MPDDPVRPGLRFLYSRRAFWRALFQEVLVASGVLYGGRECRLEDLGRLPDDVLARIRPMVHRPRRRAPTFGTWPSGGTAGGSRSSLT